MARMSEFTTDNINGIAPTPVEKFVINKYFVNDALFNIMDFTPNGGGLPGDHNLKCSITAYSEDGTTDAVFRQIGTEYTPANAVPEQLIFTLKQLGGAIEIDRVVTRGVSNNRNEDTTKSEQIKQKTNSIKNSFLKYFISGNSSTNALQFDGVYKDCAGHTSQENTTPYALGGSVSGDKFLSMELHFNEAISKMNCTPNCVITTRSGAALAKTLNTHRNWPTNVVDIDSVKYNQLMGIPIVTAPDSYFPADKTAIGIPYIFLYLADDELGIKCSIPADGKIIDYIEPEVGNGVMVRAGALEMVICPIFANYMAYSICYVTNTAPTPETPADNSGEEETVG